MKRFLSFLFLGIITMAAPGACVHAAPLKTTIYVSTAGTNSNGSGSEKRPYKTIDYALSKALPGTTIVVMKGQYPEYLKTYRDGQKGAPITLVARGPVVITGDRKHERVMDLLHDYYVISGFEFKGRGVHLRLYDADNTLIEKNYFHHADEECVLLRSNSSSNTFSRNRIEHCGLEDFTRHGGGKNGEGIYIGTAPEQLKKGTVDHSNGNHVINNRIATFGNECVDIKEGSEKNLIEFNDCSQQKDPHSGGFDSRGNNNIFRYNKSYNNVGSGVRLGGDTKQQGIQNYVYGNVLYQNKQYAIKAMRLPQNITCGNTVATNSAGFSNQSSLRNTSCVFPLRKAGIQP